MESKIPLYDGTNACVQTLTGEQAQELVDQQLAKPIGRRTLRGLQLLVEISTALAVLRAAKFPVCQGSRTFIRIRIADSYVYQHHRARCNAFASPIA